MKFRTVVLGSILAAVVGGAGPGEPPSDVVVHEWGTFLAMNGSDGVTLDGMYHEEHALPRFVHARSRDQLRIPSVRMKGETPVIYFYTGTAQKVQVGVRFPTGLWTQWYPQAQRVGPQLSESVSPSELRDGRIIWCAEILPAGSQKPALPKTADDALWNFARDVDAAYVRTPDGTKGNAFETERFLFYRGLGRALLPLKLDAGGGGTLALGDAGPRGLRHVFVVRVEGGKGVYSYRPAIAPGEQVSGVIPSMQEARPLPELVAALAKDMETRLVESGLYAKEARAMVNTWRRSYFETEGIRALFVMPQTWTDAFIPMEISPPPKDLVRVMVGRLELLTPDREQRAEVAVRDLTAPDAATRRAAFDFLREQGRYVEPIVRRVLTTTKDERVKSVCKRLLAADFVTDLRAAIHAAGDGSRLADEPVHVRAQLAGLLREIGLNAEAKAEATAVIRALRSKPAPALNHADSRQYLRAYARAMAGLGDDDGEAQWCETFVRFGSQVAKSENCRGCHQDAGPRDMAWFQDWWAGRRYAESLARRGRVDSEIAEHEVTIASHPGDVATRMLLAYLYESKGQADKASSQWSQISPKPGLSLGTKLSRRSR